ncbi:MAG: hypothetical protein V3T17_07355 [Pseudomonadales bacterium]
MRALAEYVMKGRTEAVLAVVLTTGTVLFAWVGAAVLALVILRKGSSQGVYLLFWALIPAVVVAAFGDTGPVTTLVGVTFVATVLRVTSSWSWALVIAVVSGVLTGIVLLTLGQGYIEQILQLLGDTLAQLASQSVNSEQSAQWVALQPSVQQVAGLLGLSNAFTVIMCLILARWWQALLYNPGGFRAEFHSLRLTPPLTVLLLTMGLLLSSLGAEYRLWALIFAVPFMFSGFALIHGLVAQKQLNANWLGVFYFFWLLLDPVKALVLILAVVDSWLNIRGRLAKCQTPP